ncbi:phosphatase PAP2 family protein [Actinomadura madurae]|uniref:phosphatase PAP2 family protein n=1 Tax=Actinomadura madurae TaxID=1993 RepID=UPI0020D2533A|nr:phosphatase PAP2 family protein [Actinomadura madurae]MCP9953198.1 phosphatase PAP2 family protein [Actinomadura madurae]MCP9969957.1 phosphatase PAP2 family protein [Actinomadura madurae]MCP9982413.1 phosphatase PAP2 family protein [Actinomadura madurae]MCQ0006058.1 phosphatase PAP2 family protein [Actinomadura madurae]MCQ0018658.1 phosphatase PAP2 family protein [Actinomadura madurae]
MTSQLPFSGTWRFKAAVGGALCLIVVGVAGVAMGDRVPPLDSWIVRNLYSSPETTPALIATVISGVGTLFGIGLLLVTASRLLWRRRGQGLRLLPRYGALLVVCVATVALQAAFQRPGPPVTSQDWTYPSGHVTVLSALTFTAIVISMELSREWRVIVVVGSVVTLVAVSASRITLGEHYLVDVVAALFATIGVGLLAVAAMNLRPRFRPELGSPPH